MAGWVVTMNFRDEDDGRPIKRLPLVLRTENPSLYKRLWRLIVGHPDYYGDYRYSRQPRPDKHKNHRR